MINIKINRDDTIKMQNILSKIDNKNNNFLNFSYLLDEGMLRKHNDEKGDARGVDFYQLEYFPCIIILTSSKKESVDDIINANDWVWVKESKFTDANEKILSLNEFEEAINNLKIKYKK